MTSPHPGASRVERFALTLADEFARRFPRSRAAFDADPGYLLDHSSHAMRWSDPFMPIARRAQGAAFEDLDGHRIIDYWQGHFANVLGHNPPLVTEALGRLLSDGRGLQSGMLHELESEVAQLICEATGMETLRFTTSGTLGTLYATMLARAFTGRQRVLKIAGGWHGSQPFGLKGVVARGGNFDHMESEGLAPTATDEIGLTRFNDLDDLRSVFAADGDRLACMIVEPLLGAGGGMAAAPAYLREARRLTELHGALLICDEIITGFRFRAGDLSSMLGVRPDLMILGKVVGGGLPLAAVAGRRDAMALAGRAQGRVKFEGGTYSAMELPLMASKTMLTHLKGEEGRIYPTLARRAARMRRELAELAAAAGVPLGVLAPPKVDGAGGSLVFAHVMGSVAAAPTSPEGLVSTAHPRISERLLKATLLLEGVSTRSGLGALSAAHTEPELARTLDAFRAAFARLSRAELI